MSELFENTITSKTIFQGKILNLKKYKVKLPDDSESMREIVEHSGGVCILPVTDNDNKIIMVKQYRKAPEEILLELPAGKLEPGEKPEKCAERELLEETGYKVEEMEQLFSFYTTPGYSNEILHLFQAKVFAYKEKNLDKDEFIEIEKISPDGIKNLIFQGKIKDSKTIIGLLYYLNEDFKEDKGDIKHE
ncbi:MAG: NUDIX hydrolase [Bacillota bacterium]